MLYYSSRVLLPWILKFYILLAPEMETANKPCLKWILRGNTHISIFVSLKSVVIVIYCFHLHPQPPGPKPFSNLRWSCAHSTLRSEKHLHHQEPLPSGIRTPPPHETIQRWNFLIRFGELKSCHFLIRTCRPPAVNSPSTTTTFARTLSKGRVV